MNNKTIQFIKNFSFTFTSNFVSLIVSTLVVLIVPKLVGVDEYGYWQLYLFYTSYVGFLHFGWNDGLYLRYGGKEYRELNKDLFHSQFYMLLMFQTFLAVLMFILSHFYLKDENKIFIFEMTSIVLVITNVRLMLLYILQSTNRIKEYAQVTMLDRVLYIILTIGLLILGIRQYDLLILADIVGKSTALMLAMYFTRDIVFLKISTFYFSFKEMYDNITVGIKLMFANIASMLIIGTVRFGIERSWDVATFGKISLTLSVSNLMMLFINAVGIIMFPILRRTDDAKLKYLYVTIRDFLMIVLLGGLFLYYPLNIVLNAWLPKYKDSLIFMSLLFPMFVYEGKMALLINTYLKTLRKEKLMLKINLISFSLSIITTLLTTLYLKNLNLAIFSIIMLLIIRSSIAELYLSKILSISVTKDIVLETLTASSFIITSWYMRSILGITLYFVTFSIYIIYKRKDLINSMKNLKVLMKG